MKMEKIDKYIEDEKAITPSPFLESRILARIENLEREQIPMPKRARLWPSVAVAAGIAIIAFTGIKIGSTYKNPSSDYAGLIVNDNYIEQLSIYTADDNE